MERLDSMEKGETKPLLYKRTMSRSYSIKAPLSPLEPSGVPREPHLRHKRSHWRGPAIILGFNWLESTAFNGISTNLVVYLRTALHESNTWTAAMYSVWNGTSYFTPLFGAIIADSYLGNYRTIFCSTIMYLLGMVIITLTALNPSLRQLLCEGNSCQPASVVQYIAIFSGLYLVAFGTGGVKSALLPFGAEQFDDEIPKEREEKGFFFNKFYICLSVGLLTSSIFIVWIQSNIDWALGFGIATLCMAVALGGFILGTPSYRIKMPSGSPFKCILQVLVASFRKMMLELPEDSSFLYELNDKECDVSDQPRLEHTDGLRFLDKAAIIWDFDFKEAGDPQSSWRLCTVTQVEEVKILVRFLPVWATGILFSAAYSQMYTTFIQQGSSMNNKFGSFSIPPASLTAFHVFCAMAWVFMYNKIIVPIVGEKNGVGLSQLQRIGVGRFMIILTMAAAAYVEDRRLANAKAGMTTSIAWQLPQYFLIAGSEIFNNIAQLEFFYGQAPCSMKSMCTAFGLLTIAMGNYVSSVIVTLVAAVTTRGGSPGWISDNLNEGHLDYFFWGMAALCTLNFAIYLAFASRYKLKKVICGELKL